MAVLISEGAVTILPALLGWKDTFWSQLALLGLGKDSLLTLDLCFLLCKMRTTNLISPPNRTVVKIKPENVCGKYF
jgi:hypothetical protein